MHDTRTDPHIRRTASERPDRPRRRRPSMAPFTGALEADAGLASSWSFNRGRNGLWMLAVELAPRPFPGQRFSLEAVGAVGLHRRPTMFRAVGEAVERFALVPPHTWKDAPRPESVVAGSAAVVDLHDAGFSERIPVDAVIDVLPATEILRDTAIAEEGFLGGRQCRMPSAAIDYPGTDQRFDPTPSGAASGLSLSFALNSALGEVLERDAFMRAWFRRELLCRIPEMVVQRMPAAQSLTDHAETGGLDLFFGCLPVAYPGLHCVAALALARDGSIGAVGMKSSPTLMKAIEGAGQEALQVADVFDGMHRLGEESITNAQLVTDDLMRARYWLQREAIDDVARWFRQAEAMPAATLAVDHGPVTSSAMIESIIDDGGRPVVVDLTDRLPPAVQLLGWRVVKVLTLGYQGLAMDETADYAFNLARLGIEDRTSTRPHPLI